LLEARSIDDRRLNGRWLTIVGALVLGLLSSLEPRVTLLGAAILGLILLVTRDVLAPQRAVVIVLVAKPLIDLAWRWDFFTVGQQGVNAQSLAAAFLVMVAAIAILRRGGAPAWSNALVWLLITAGVSVALTPTAMGLNELIRLYAGASLFFVSTEALGTEPAFHRFASAFLAAVSVPLVLCLLQVVGILPFEYWDWQDLAPVGRASGTYQHPLGVVYFIIYAIPLALYLMDRSRSSGPRRFLLSGFLALAVVCLFLTRHRTGMVACVSGIVLWLALSRRTRGAWTVVAVGFAAVVLMRGLQRLYGDAFDLAQGGDLLGGAFLRGRGLRWYLFIKAIVESHPVLWLVGRGGSVAEGMVPFFGYWASNEPHNDLIRLLHAYGLVGCGLYVALVAGFVVDGLRLMREGDEHERGLGVLMVVWTGCVAVMSLTTEPTRYPSGIWYLFALASVVRVRAWRYRRLPKPVPVDAARRSS